MGHENLGQSATVDPDFNWVSLGSKGVATVKPRCRGGSHGAALESPADGGADQRGTEDRCCLLQLVIRRQGGVDRCVVAAAAAAWPRWAGPPDRRAWTGRRLRGRRRPSGDRQ